MKNTRFAIPLIALAVLGSACDDSSSDSKSCAVNADCDTNLCLGGICVKRCTVNSCAENEVCADDGICKPIECTDSKPCPDPARVCKNNRCVTAECSDSSPCADSSKVCRSGLCIDPQCSPSQPCTDASKICHMSVCIDPECTEDKPCTGENQICENHFCTYECTAAKPCADPEKVCRNGVCEDECSEMHPCADPEKSCVSGKCIVKVPDACTAGSCKKGTVCGEDGLCFDAECSSIDKCPDGKTCQNRKCVTRDELICYRDSDCGKGYGCDNKKCVPENSCSLSRTCPEDKICRNGECTDPDTVECSQYIPCADTSKTCIQGKCTTCGCTGEESCTVDGKCVTTNVSESGKVKVGDPCDFESFRSHCDGNRKFSCIDNRVRVEDCGSKVCATAPEEGIGCYDACEHEDDFYGECKEWSAVNEFTKRCSNTSEGHLVWSLQHGFRECIDGCTNGRCNFIPKEFNPPTPCNETTYPDACQGDWLTYCFHGFSTGTACSTYSDAHFCALPSENAQKLNAKINPGTKLIGVCAAPCNNPGSIHNECIDTGDSQMSMKFLCSTTVDGKLADFEAGYRTCTNGCNPETGLCL